MELESLTELIIGRSIEVHRVLGPGLMEAAYEAALSIELDDAGVSYVRQVAIAATYKGRMVGNYRVDFIVENEVLVEIKSVQRYEPLFAAQMLTYLRITGKRVGLLVNFNTALLKEGVKRFVL